MDLPSAGNEKWTTAKSLATTLTLAVITIIPTGTKSKKAIRTTGYKNKNGIINLEKKKRRYTKMKRNYNDFDRYALYEDLDSLCYDDGSHSYDRRRELERRRYSGYDTYIGSSDDYNDWN